MKIILVNNPKDLTEEQKEKVSRVISAFNNISTILGIYDKLLEKLKKEDKDEIKRNS